MSDDQFTLPLAKQVFLTSFYLSQGYPSLQHYLLHAVALLRPAWRLSEEDRQALEGLGSTIHLLAARKVHPPFIKPGEVEKELREQSTLLQRELAHTTILTGDWDEVLFQVLECFIARDHRYLIRLQGRSRPSHTGTEVPRPRHDPHLSFFCHYILLRQSVGCEVFDELLMKAADAWTDQGSVFQRLMSLSFLRSWLPKIVALHNATHSQATISNKLPQALESQEEME